MAVGGELHADEEQVLIEQGTAQADLWGINLYRTAGQGLVGVRFDDKHTAVGR